MQTLFSNPIPPEVDEKVAVKAQEPPSRPIPSDLLDAWLRRAVLTLSLWLVCYWLGVAAGRL